MACAVAHSAVATEIYMETEDPVRRGDVIKNLERLGARHIIVHSFPRNDQEHLANKFMGRVLEQAKQNFRKLYIRGSTNTVPVLQRVEQDYEIWMGTLRQLDGSTGEFSGPRDGEWTEEDRTRCVAAMMAVVSLPFFCVVWVVRNTHIAPQHEGRAPPQYKGASMVVEESVSPEVALAELECVAGVLDERASEWKRRLEACEARRVLEGEELRAQLVAQQEECEARLVHQETIHAGKMVAKDAEWEARLAAKVLELSGASLSEGVADARLAAMVADCEAQLANRNVEHREQLAARDLAHARTKDILDDKKLQKLQLTLRVEMEDRFSALKRELADERQLCARFRADLAVSAGHVNTLEEEKMSGQWGGYQCDDSDDELGLSMTRMTESERNQKLRCLLAQSAVTRKEAWLARDAEYDMVTALQKKLDDKETEGRIVVDRLKQEIRGLEFLVADERQLRKRAGKGDIFHEEGKVLVKCTKCFQVRLGYHRGM